MMTKKEQIEEMCEAIASMICQIYNPQCDEYEPHTCSHCYVNDTLIGDFAEMLYDAGYRKVVSGRDGFVDLLNEETKELSIIEKTRKETAKEIISAMKTMITNRRADERSGLNLIYTTYSPERLFNDISEYVRITVGVEV